MLSMYKTTAFLQRKAMNGRHHGRRRRQPPPQSKGKWQLILSTGIHRPTDTHSQNTWENNQVGFEYIPVFFVLSFAWIFV